MNLGTTIQMLRWEHGLTQKDLATLVGISVNALSLIETNETFPKKETIKLICKGLGVPVAYLLLCTISDEDVPEDRLIPFSLISKAMKELLVAVGPPEDGTWYVEFTPQHPTPGKGSLLSEKKSYEILRLVRRIQELNQKLTKLVGPENDE